MFKIHIISRSGCTAAVYQGGGARSAADAVQVPLHLQPARPIAHLPRPDDDHSGPLRPSPPVSASLAQRVHSRLLRPAYQRRRPIGRARRYRISQLLYPVYGGSKKWVAR